MSWPAAYGRVMLAETDSTMDEARRQSAHRAAPFWVFAERQTAARGRRGRAWAHPEGNFSATLVLRPEGGPAQAALRSFVAALALYDAFVALTGRPEPFALKWPNDVLLNGGKVAGILLEGGGDGVVAIGIGVNLIAAPDRDSVEPGAVPPVSLLSETGAAVTPEQCLDALADAYAAREASFAAYGFGPTREAWLARAARLGQPVNARTGRSETTGTFETVDAQGQLVLKTSAGRVAIPAADVHF
ncbi:biotin--[acetyl-CoA-carboxylase] ligase [Litorisediminicola beolgyonensis]|uniref:biotin--[biotin carboxyl-carrier protein] ligase n=1 Tax=Litorisediminicola beolgyonensis TaxID=1173614 RepID=A0ABW3ZLS7_9RHOB